MRVLPVALALLMLAAPVVRADETASNAAEAGRLPEVAAWVQAGHAASPLLFAAVNGDRPEIVRFLLQHEADRTSAAPTP